MRVLSKKVIFAGRSLFSFTDSSQRRLLWRASVFPDLSKRVQLQHTGALLEWAHPMTEDSDPRKSTKSPMEPMSETAEKCYLRHARGAQRAVDPGHQHVVWTLDLGTAVPVSS